MRLFLALGPGDIVGARRAALAGITVPGTSIAFSEQILSYCRAHDITTLALSSNRRSDNLQDDKIRLENRPRVLGGGGIRFHISMLLYAVYLAFRARRFKAGLAIIDSGTTHYFALTMFWLLGIPVAVNLHNVLWPNGYLPVRKKDRLILLLNSMFFRHIAIGAIGVSPECERQVKTVARYPIAFHQYRCQFLSDGFQTALPYRGGEFRVAFVGRAEVNKGLLDLVDIADQLRSASEVRVIFDICGDGAALAEFKMRVDEYNLNDCMIVHGQLARADLLNVYANSHAVIVPTRSSFGEGMPQTCAEAVLSCLPVISSLVTNVFDVIGSACVRAETDDIDSYVRAILSLIERPEIYDQLRSQCGSLSKQFIDMEQGYAAATGRLIRDICGESALISVGARSRF
jgi:glycogen(starch) synthase